MQHYQISFSSETKIYLSKGIASHINHYRDIRVSVKLPKGFLRWDRSPRDNNGYWHLRRQAADCWDDQLVSPGRWVPAFHVNETLTAYFFKPNSFLSCLKSTCKNVWQPLQMQFHFYQILQFGYIEYLTRAGCLLRGRKKAFGIHI